MSPASIFAAAPTDAATGTHTVPRRSTVSFATFLSGSGEWAATATHPQQSAAKAGLPPKQVARRADPAVLKKPLSKKAGPEGQKATPTTLPSNPLEVISVSATQSSVLSQSETPRGEHAGTGDVLGETVKASDGDATGSVAQLALPALTEGDAKLSVPRDTVPDRAELATKKPASEPAPATPIGKATANVSQKPAGIKAVPVVAFLPPGQLPVADGTPHAAPEAVVSPSPPAPGTSAPAGSASGPDLATAIQQVAPLPVAQLGNALAGLHINSDGTSKLTIRLDPAELGQVRVEITRGQDGASSVTVAVERLETLGRLQSDLTHLHLALDRAGVPEHRSLVLHLAPQEPASASAGTAGGFQSGTHGRQGGQHSGFQPGAGTFGPAGQGPASGRPRFEPPASRTGPTHRRIDAGIDITA